MHGQIEDDSFRTEQSVALIPYRLTDAAAVQLSLRRDRQQHRHWHWKCTGIERLGSRMASHRMTLRVCDYVCVCLCAVRSHYVTPASVGNNNLTEHSLCASVCAQVIYASLGPNKLAYCPTEMIYHWPPGHCQYFPCALPQWN